MKLLSLTEEQIAATIEEFRVYMQNLKTNTGKITFDKKMEDVLPDIKKPIVQFTTDAWIKMRALVENSFDEIGWHGVVTKTDNVYLITDILVYPQTVTATTVTIDTSEYSKWLMHQPDETFYNIRMQGHSHVRMGTSPSGVDANMYQDFLNMLEDDDYYIFIITNKDADMNIMIYDYPQNCLFERTDITWQVLFEDGTATKDWYVEQAALVTKKTYSTGLGNVVYHGNTVKPDPKPEPKSTDSKKKKKDIKGSEEPISDDDIDAYYEAIYGRRYIY